MNARGVVPQAKVTSPTKRWWAAGHVEEFSRASDKLEGQAFARFFFVEEQEMGADSKTIHDYVAADRRRRRERTKPAPLKPDIRK